MRLIQAKQLAGGGFAPGVPNAAAFFNGSGSMTGVPDYLAGALDAFSRPAVRDFRLGPGGRGAVYKLGAWGVDGDPQNVTSEGYVTYGANALGLGPDGAQGGFGFYEPNGFGELNIIPGVNGGNTFYICGFEDGSVNAPFGLDGFIVNDNTNVPIAWIKRSNNTSNFRTVTTGLNGTPATWSAGAGVPNGTVLGSPGDTYSNTSGGVGTTLWAKESGVGTDTGWAPIPSAPLPSASRQFYVDKGGSDSNNGSVTAPFLTIAHAIVAINALGDASTTKRYNILLGPGDWADVIVLPAWVWIVGAGDVIATRLNGNISLDPATWSIPGPTVDVRGGLSNLILRGVVTIDFNAANSNYGKLYFNNCTLNNSPTFSSFVGPLASGINQIYLQNCVMFAGYTQNGINLTLYGTEFINGGTIFINSVNIGHPTLMKALGGGTDALSVAIHATWTVGVPPSANDIEIQLFGFGVAGNVILDGASISYSATAEGMPLSVTRLNGASAPVSLSPSIDQGGNSFGAPLDIGTNDGQPAQLGAFTALVPQAFVRLDPGAGTPVASLDTVAAGHVNLITGAGAQLNIGVGATGVRQGQVTQANGDFAVAGDAQSWSLTLRGQTPGLLPNESVELQYGILNDQWITGQDGKAYVITVHMVAVSPGGGEYAVFQTTFSAEQEGGVFIDPHARVGIAPVEATVGPATAWRMYVGSGGAGTPLGAPSRISVSFQSAGELSAFIFRAVAKVDIVEVLQHA